MAGQLDAIEHVVVLMLENRSFDQMLGFLYEDAGNRSPSGQAFDGLTGRESNPDSNGNPVPVRRLTSADPHPYFQPGSDPGEGYQATNSQLFGSMTPPSPAVATNDGFVADFAYTLGWENKSPRWKSQVMAGTTAASIMSTYGPELLPVLSGLARGFAVCDHWFASAPTETLPNRAFANAATSQGHLDDNTKTYTCRSIFGLLSDHGLDWRIYGYALDPLTRKNFPDTTNAPETHFGIFGDFQAAAAAGTLPPYTFLEPSWGSNGNSQHPNYDVALGEALIHDAYRAVRDGPGWNQTLLIVTYDEHGGCYDHVPPPLGALPPDQSIGEQQFDFTRFGVRVPTVLVSPWIPAGTVYRALDTTGPPLDHTSILATLEHRWNLPPLTARDGAAPDIAAVLSETTPRTDDPLSGVPVPTARQLRQPAGPSHMQRVHAELVADLPVPGQRLPPSEQLAGLTTTDDYHRFIEQRIGEWKHARGVNA
jgi:phospholipase C